MLHINTKIGKHWDLNEEKVLSGQREIEEEFSS